jgi:O-methyltransferase involved in polyketide biosynthesis
MLPGPAGAAAGFDPTQPTLFTVEGLIYYLPTAAVQQLFASLLRVAAPGSRVAFDFLHKQVRLHN